MAPQSKQKDVLGFVGWLIVTFTASVVGARASVEAGVFYGQLVQPSWAPPPWLFGPVWTMLYALMAIAAWLVWRSNETSSRRRLALALFVAQLALNALWSWLFFAWRLGALAFAEVVLLWMLVVATLVAFWRVRPLAGTLLMPYLGWVGFAAVLNYAVWQLNPRVLG
jgi:tryptophan-rich sensory protein